eukprot:9004386-Alexandrium_andersonii.AAC.1
MPGRLSQMPGRSSQMPVRLSQMPSRLGQTPNGNPSLARKRRPALDLQCLGKLVSVSVSHALRCLSSGSGWAGP